MFVIIFCNSHYYRGKIVHVSEKSLNETKILLIDDGIVMQKSYVSADQTRIYSFPVKTINNPIRIQLTLAECSIPCRLDGIQPRLGPEEALLKRFSSEATAKFNEILGIPLRVEFPMYNLPIEATHYKRSPKDIVPLNVVSSISAEGSNMKAENISKILIESGLAGKCERLEIQGDAGHPTITLIDYESSILGRVL